MPRYELDGKYWEITLKGSVVTTRTGKSGMRSYASDGKMIHGEDPGRSSDRALKDPRAARAHLDKQIATRVAAGWKRLDGLDGIVEDLSPTQRDAALEAAIVETGDDATYLVYADWLQQRGNPRGELISMQHAMRAQGNAADFLVWKKREQVLRHAHERAWLGDIAADCVYRLKLEWRLGFVETARVLGATHPKEPTLHELVEGLHGSACGCALRNLTLRGRAVELVAAVEHLPFAGLRRLQLETYDDTSLLNAHRDRIIGAGVAVVVTHPQT